MGLYYLLRSLAPARAWPHLSSCCAACIGATSGHPVAASWRLLRCCQALRIAATKHATHEDAENTWTTGGTASWRELQGSSGCGHTWLVPGHISYTAGGQTCSRHLTI
jgi:hypothetical protein